MFRYAFIVTLFAGLVFAAPIASEPLSFRIDTNHSNIGFAVSIMGGLSKVRGKFSEFEMELNYDREDITKSTVAVKIKSASVDTGIDQRDDHLRTADFFDVEKFPEITFKSKKVSKKNGRYYLTGDFTMHGVTKEIEFPFEITGEEESKKGDQTRLNVGFAAKLVVDRSKFDINWQHNSVPGFVGNDVEVDLHIITRSKVIAESKQD